MNETQPSSDPAHQTFLTTISVISLVLGVIGSFYAFGSAWVGKEEVRMTYLVLGLCFFVIGLGVGLKCGRFRLLPLIAGSIGMSFFPVALMIMPMFLYGLLAVWVSGGLGQQVGILIKKN